MRTAPSVITSMSQESSSPASPSRPVPASELQETVTPVSHVFSLSEVSASLEALNIEVEKNQMWYTMHKLATPSELAGLQSPQTHETTGGPYQSRLRSQRGMLSRYGWKLRWDLDTLYPWRTIPVPQISPSRL